MSTPRYVWQPTTAEIATQAGIPESEVERFDHNTSPFPTQWAAAVAANAISGLNEYPAASYDAIRTAVATYRGMTPFCCVICCRPVVDSVNCRSILTSLSEDKR